MVYNLANKNHNKTLDSIVHEYITFNTRCDAGVQEAEIANP